MIADFVPGAQFSGATWRDTVNNSLRRRLKPVSVFVPLCKNMTSSTKPEVHNVLHCCLLSAENRATAIDNMHRKFRDVGHMVFEICEQKDK